MPIRNPADLRVFALADDLAVAVYVLTRRFPTEELFGLTRQMRRAAVSIPSNLAEGCARPSAREFAHFVAMAHGSALELQYQLSLAVRLGFVPRVDSKPTSDLTDRVAKMLHSLAATARSRIR